MELRSVMVLQKQNFEALWTLPEALFSLTLCWPTIGAHENLRAMERTTITGMKKGIPTDCEPPFHAGSQS